MAVSAQTKTAFDPSSFVALVSFLGAQAQLFLGLMDNPLTGKRETPDPARARSFIATLEMLESKTKGNLTEEEDRFLTTILTDLHVRFAQVSDEASGESTS